MLLGACGAEESQETAPSPEEAQGAPSPSPIQVPPLAGTAVEGDEASDSSVKLYVEFDGIGALHKSFFLDDRVTAELQERLRGHVDGAVGVRVAYDNRTGRGSIRIQVEPHKIVAAKGKSDEWSTSALTPFTKAAAFYRDWVASHFDLRVQNFGIGLDITPARALCAVEVAGSPPPDGEELAPCITVDGEEICGTPSGETLNFPAEHRDAVAKCF